MASRHLFRDPLLFSQSKHRPHLNACQVRIGHLPNARSATYASGDVISGVSTRSSDFAAVLGGGAVLCLRSRREGGLFSSAFAN
jgi:hypothetical protein